MGSRHGRRVEFGFSIYPDMTSQMQQDKDKRMELKNLLEAVRNDQIEFVTMRPPGWRINSGVAN